jgi:hypothetical protein
MFKHKTSEKGANCQQLNIQNIESNKTKHSSQCKKIMMLVPHACTTPTLKQAKA